MPKITQNYSPSIQAMTELLHTKKPETSKTDESSQLSFQDVLTSTANKQEVASSHVLKFSKHANARLATRNINLSNEQMQRLESGTTKAREKGIQESLVLVDGLAFIVNVKNNTVITAMDDSSDAVFTNIDGAVIN